MKMPQVSRSLSAALPSASRRRMLGAAALGLAVPVPRAFSQIRHRITIGFQPVVTGALWVARGEGFFDQVGLDVDWIRFTSAIAQITGLQGGQIHFGQGAPGPYFAGRLNGADLCWATTFMDYNPVMGLVVRPGSTVRSPADLKGRRIATRLGTDGYFLALKTLRAHGVSPKEVEWVNLELPMQVAAIKAGDVEAAYTWDPFLSQVVSFGGRVLARGNDFGLGPAVVGWASKASWVAANREAALKAITALQMGYAAMQKRPELIARYTTQFTGIAAPEAEAQAKSVGFFSPTGMVDSSSPVYWGAGTAFSQLMDHWQDFAVDERMIRQRGDLEAYVRPGLELQAEVRRRV